MKIFVAIPSYDPKLQIEVVNCLLNEQKIALGIGCEFMTDMLSGDAGIVGARNQLVAEFFKTDFDRLVFLDADITWEPGDLIKLAHQPVDFVGGSYRYKFDREAYPISWAKTEDNSFNGIDRGDGTALLEVERLPTGFLALSRRVFETIAAANPDRLYKHFEHGAYAFFQMLYSQEEKCLLGEDYFFCNEWRKLGEKIYLDPEIKLTHWGHKPTPYPGHIGNWLKQGLHQKESSK